jgi:hypothetical protein
MLSTGVEHEFSLSGPLFAPRTFSRRIPAGAGDFNVPIALTYQATLYVDIAGSNGNVRVGVGGANGRGRTRQIVAVDLGTARNAPLSIVVERAGSVRHEVLQQFTAGEQTRLEVSLDPAIGPTAENQTGSEDESPSP